MNEVYVVAPACCPMSSSGMISQLLPNGYRIFRVSNQIKQGRFDRQHNNGQRAISSGHKLCVFLSFARVRRTFGTIHNVPQPILRQGHPTLHFPGGIVRTVQRNNRQSSILMPLYSTGSSKLHRRHAIQSREPSVCLPSLRTWAHNLSQMSRIACATRESDFAGSQNRRWYIVQNRNHVFTYSCYRTF